MAVLLTLLTALTLSVSPRMQMAPGRVRLDVTIEPHYQNVLLVEGWIRCDSETRCDPERDFTTVRMSQHPLNGQYAPKHSEYVWTRLRPGFYVAVAELYRAPSTLVERRKVEFVVIGDEQEHR